MSKYINSINEIVGSESIDTHKISSLFSNIRNLLDQDKKRHTYELLYFFCDWSNHIDLDRSTFCRDMLDRLSDIWLELKDKKGVTNREIIYAFNRNVFSFKILRDELLGLFKEYRIDNSIIASDSEWKNFTSVILFHLSGRPLKRSSKYKYKLPDEDYIVSFAIVNPIDEDDDILRMIASYENTYHFNIITKDELNMVGIFFLN